MNPTPIKNWALKPFIQNLSGVEFLNKLLPNMVGLAFVIGIVIFFFVFIFGAIQWITSGGDKAGLESARSKIVNALVFSVFVILKIIEDFFGINILTIDLGVFFIQ